MKYTIRTPQDHTRIISHIQAQELPISVEVKPYKSQRSIEQNKLYWKWLDMIRLHIFDSGGELFTAEDLAEWYKAKFLPSKVVSVDREAIRCRATTTKLNTKEMTDYIESIERHAAQSLNLILPMDDILKGR